MRARKKFQLAMATLVRIQNPTGIYKMKNQTHVTSEWANIICHYIPIRYNSPLIVYWMKYNVVVKKRIVFCLIFFFSISFFLSLSLLISNNKNK